MRRMMLFTSLEYEWHTEGQGFGMNIILGGHPSGHKTRRTNSIGIRDLGSSHEQKDAWSYGGGFVVYYMYLVSSYHTSNHDATSHELTPGPIQGVCMA